MTIEVNWAAQMPDVILYQFGTQWRWDEFLDAKDHAETMIDAVQRPAYVIFHAPDLINLPPDFHRMIKNVLSALHPNTQGLILVSETPFIKGFFDILNRKRQIDSPHYIHIVDELEDAYQLIALKRNIVRVSA